MLEAHVVTFSVATMVAKKKMGRPKRMPVLAFEGADRLRKMPKAKTSATIFFKFRVHKINPI